MMRQVFTLLLAAWVSVVIPGCTSPTITVVESVVPPELTAEERAERTRVSLDITFYSKRNSLENPYPYVGAVILDGHKIGSGILLDPNSVLTAAHVVLTPGQYSFEVEGGSPVPVCWLAIHAEPDEHDLAVLTLSSPVLCGSYADITPIKIPRFKCLITVGYSFGYKKWSKPCTFYYYGVLAGDVNSLKYRNRGFPTWFGDSGGALIYIDSATSQGHVVGILAGIVVVNGEVQECAATKVDNYLDWIQKEAN